MLTKGHLEQLMAEYNFRPKKRLGQNFLADSHILEKIITCAGITKEDVVVEIGAGPGILTHSLAKEARAVIAVEIDKTLCEIMKTMLIGHKNVEIACCDILRFDIRSVSKKYGKKKVKVVGNVPYYITTPIISYFLECRSIVESMVITIQEEVAMRLIAKAGERDRGAISCFVQFYTHPSIISHIGKNTFFPAPKVDSCLVKLDVREHLPVYVRDENVFFKIVRASFSQRRKTILNSLSTGSTSLNKETLSTVLRESNIDPMRRGETLSLEEFSKIANAVTLLLE